MNTPADPPFVIVTERPRRPTRSMWSRVNSLVSSLAVVGLICFVVYLGVTTNKPYIVGKEGGQPGLVKSPPKSARPITPDGGGGQREPIQPVVHNPMPAPSSESIEHASPNNPKAERIARVDDLVHESLKAAKQGMFGKANDLADEARQLESDHPAATGAWYLAAYAEKYPDLADEALEKLSGDDIYLGRKYGRVAFVEREGDIYKFRWRGGKLELTLAELQKMDDVRFEMTRKFLDNADFTANHLILAAIHHLKNIDETGRYNLKQPEKCLEAAVARCEKAAGQGDEAAKHAGHMLALFAWLEPEPTANQVVSER